MSGGAASSDLRSRAGAICGSQGPLGRAPARTSFQRPRRAGAFRWSASVPVLAALLPGVAAAGGPAWYNEEYEYNFLEMMMLMVMVVFALAFESSWHHFTHSAEHSYRYGQVESIVVMANSRKHASPFGSVKNLQLFRELANRTGGEFMTLGYLAAVVYFSRQAGGFDWLAKVTADSEWPFPRTSADWLHMAENVHMKLFFAMVFYFIMTQRLVAGAVHRIRLWEHVRLKRIVPNFEDIDGVPHIAFTDEDMAEHSLWRRYFMAKMIRWRRRKPSIFKRLISTLNFDAEDPNLDEKFYKLLDTDFSFSAYLSVTVEKGVRDAIQVHRSTWLVLLILLIIFAILHRFLFVPLPMITFGLAILAVLCIGIMRYLIRRTRLRMDERAAEDMAETVPSLRSQASRVSLTSSGTQSTTTTATALPSWVQDGSISGRKRQTVFQRLARRLRYKYRTQLVMVRLLQVVLFLMSYLFSRTVLDFADWSSNTEFSLLSTALYLIGFAIMAYDLPKSVPLFLGVMSLPPHMGYKQFKIFSAVLLQNQEASYQKELADLKAKLLQTGDGDWDDVESNDIVIAPRRDPAERPPPLESEDSMNFEEEKEDKASSSCICFPMVSSRIPDGLKKMSKKNTSNRPNRLLIEFGDLFRTFIAVGHQKGLDNDELLTGLKLHLGLPVLSQTRNAKGGAYVQLANTRSFDTLPPVEGSDVVDLNSGRDSPKSGMQDDVDIGSGVILGPWAETAV
mmetsp:Transcript_16459/g.47688  ORF Transcript_16459/g.47688 Transcript_16459/m.47688 type:complete len:735 (-) Transcript_16459:234-2438(-)